MDYQMRLLIILLSIMLIMTMSLGLENHFDQEELGNQIEIKDFIDGVESEGVSQDRAAGEPNSSPVGIKIPIAEANGDGIEVERWRKDTREESTLDPAPDVEKNAAQVDNDPGDKLDDIDDSPIQVVSSKDPMDLEAEEAVMSVRKMPVLAVVLQASVNEAHSTTSRAEDSFVRLTGTSTMTVSRSGSTTTSLTLVTFDPSHTKMRRCIHGCNIITVTATGTATSTSIITVLPTTIPCSLLICPPCGCITKRISITGCPVITTSTPPDSTVTVTADATITFITVTETITDCTPTSCPPPVTVTVEVAPSRTTITQFSTEQIFVTPTTTTSTTSVPPGPPIVTIDPGCPCGYNEDPDEDEEEEPSQCPCNSNLGEASQECQQCRVYYLAAAAAKVQRPESNTKRAKKNKSCKACRPGHPHILLHPPSASTTTAQPALPYTKTIDGGVCSTFVVCNPKQFQCPSQVTTGSQLPDFLASWGLQAEAAGLKGPQEALPPTDESVGESDPQPPLVASSYVGFDGVEHPLGPGMVLSEGKGPSPLDNTKGRSDIKGFKVIVEPGAVKDTGTMKAAIIKNAASKGQQHSLGSIGIILLCVAMIFGF